ncbi:hypothetical protein ACIBCA_29740 [Kitasatospora sp. NPDC051170]|uniref:hypothetical protein n=1 Tax=Kitasatospora sp. NPDC051170 TaxID=3364056 RepID=UPI0037935DDE
MTTATVTAADRLPARAVRLVPAAPAGPSVPEDTHDRATDRATDPEPDRARTRPAHCRFALHFED